MFGKFLALGVGWIAFAIAANIIFWGAIVFYIVIPALGKLQEMGIIPTF